MTKAAYTLYTTTEWGQKFWVLKAPMSQELGRYRTKAEAMRDVKLYDLQLDLIVDNHAKIPVYRKVARR